MDFDYQLPMRTQNTDKSFDTANLKNKFLTNLYRIEPNPIKIYQYSLHFYEADDTQIQQDCLEIMRQAIHRCKKDLKNKFGYMTHSGLMMWGDHQIQLTTHMNVESFKIRQKEFKVTIQIKYVKQQRLHDLDTEQLRPQYLQILNSNIRNRVQSLGYYDMSHNSTGEYFKNTPLFDQTIKNVSLSVLRGFSLTVQYLNNCYYLEVDVKSKVCQMRNFKEMMDEENDHSYTGKHGIDIKDTIVVNTYGRPRTYKLVEINHEKNPQQNMQHLVDGKTMTYVDYFREKYGIQIRYKNQKLIKAIASDKKKKFNPQTKKFEQQIQYVNLIPELLKMTGMTDSQRNSKTALKQIEQFTKLKPSRRVKQSSLFLDAFNKTQGLFKITDPKMPMKVDGYYLNQPQIKFHGEQAKTPDKSGNFKFRTPLRENQKVVDVLYIYSEGKNPREDYNEINDLISLIENSAKTYGIQFYEKSRDLYAVRNQRIQQWKSEVQQVLTNPEVTTLPQIVVFFFNQRETSTQLYSELKNLMYQKFNCPSQVIDRKKLRNPKNSRSIAGYIAIQMNLKMGGVPWVVQKSHPYLKKKNVMCGGLSICKNKGSGKWTVTFVGTINNEGTKNRNEEVDDIRKKEQIPYAVLEKIFIEWAKAYYKYEKRFTRPDVIIIYRQGLSDAQAKSQLPKSQIPALKSMVKKIGKSTKCQNYDPQIIIVLVNKKIPTRIFQFDSNSNNHGVINAQNNPNPSITNTETGAVVIQPLSSGLYDFHMVPQYVNSGTCTPVLFRVGYEKSKMPQQALISYTFDQCHNYYNWMGAVRIPACLQYANKLSELFCVNQIQSNVKEQMKKTFHFV